jgi:hypothetical protein
VITSLADIAEAFAIVRDLAEGSVVGSGGHGQGSVCLLCWQPTGNVVDPARHAEDCPWRRAVELSAHQEGDQ